MILVRELRLAAGESKDRLRILCAKELKVSRGDILSVSLEKESLDARKKPKLSFLYSVRAEVRDEDNVLKKCAGNPRVCRYQPEAYRFPYHAEGEDGISSCRPVIIGDGPAGLFCALMLAEAGFRPVILERGDDAETRHKKTEAFWRGEGLDPESNVQFGEGGAGTFSDGKLNTGTHEKGGRNRYVLEQFVRFGADPRILYEQKPHIGTDVLLTVLLRMRAYIMSLGGTFRFRAKVTGLCVKDGRIEGVVVNKTEKIPAECVIAAIGHSARDTMEMLFEQGISMEPKAFAVGFRVAHPQQLIDRAQYGRERGEDLPPASYKLTCRTQNGRGVYSFCMCPGGYIVNASSEEGGTCVNGMSYAARDGRYANSAVIVTVSPEDYAEYAEPDKPASLAGAYFQRSIEKAVFEKGNGRIPVQSFEDYKAGRKGELPSGIMDAVRGEAVSADLSDLYPKEIKEAFLEGIPVFGKKIRGFDGKEAFLAGAETRTSSPVRMPRKENGESENVSGFYPCGEGAGYAGGIMSAASDGIRTAEACAARLLNQA